MAGTLASIEGSVSQTTPVGPRRVIDIDGAFNFRDIGGGVTVDGQPLATGRMYRSASLDELTDRGLETVERLGIRTVIDLRSQGEIDRNGRFPYERVPVRWVHVASPMGPPTDRDDPRARAFLDHPDPMSLLFKMMVSYGNGLFVDALKVMAEADSGPLVFHCTSGKDRTGLLAALLQLIVGVELEEVLADFEHSAEAVKASGHNMTARFPGIAGMPPERVERLHAADRAWVLGALEEIGGLARLDAWLDSIGVDVGMRASLRRHFLSLA